MNVTIHLSKVNVSLLMASYQCEEYVVLSCCPAFRSIGQLYQSM